MRQEKARPIIFSGPMVLAILDGKKTQTRRVVKVDQASGYMTPDEWMAPTENRPAIGGYPKPPLWALFRRPDGRGIAIRCPYGAPGAELWARESFCQWLSFDEAMGERAVCYSAGPDHAPSCQPQHRWHSPIHMPREASRLTLEIVSVRVERLQNISAADVRAEGVALPVAKDEDGSLHPLVQISGHKVDLKTIGPRSPKSEWIEDDFWRMAFAVGWDELNAKRGHAWASNPLVWAIGFKRVDR